MEALLKTVADVVSMGLVLIAILVVAVGAIEAVVGIVRVMLNRRSTGADQRAVWLKFAHWLIAGLTFQLAADIVQTTVVPTWDEIGRVAAIALIRTFLTYFLDRDIDSVSEAQQRPAAGGSDEPGA